MRSSFFLGPHLKGQTSSSWIDLMNGNDTSKMMAAVPVDFLFGSDDPLYNDYYDSNMYLWKIVRGCHYTILQGEKHLMELDTPERVADEAFAFIDQAHKDYK